MKSPTSIFSSDLTFTRLPDRMVLRTFAISICIEAVFFCILFANRTNCFDTSIKIPTLQNMHIVGEVITLIASTKNSNKSDYQWEFGDNYAAKGQQVYHAYSKAGIFRINLFSGRCKWSKEIRITSPPQMLPKPDLTQIFPAIDGPTTTFTGKPTKYSNSTSQAKTWSWCLLDVNTPTYYSGSFVELVFESEGDKILSLIINNDSTHQVTKKITVLPPPIILPPKQHKQTDSLFPIKSKPPEKNVKPLIEPISEAEFKYLLTVFANKQCNIQELLTYLCNAQIKVIINGKTIETFNHFCERINGKKKFQIEQLSFLKEENGCIKEIFIGYNKKKILGLF